jgi:hypothetical protein
MTTQFVGIPEALAYTGAGLRENPCLAVNFAMLGVGEIDECHAALVDADISSEDGESRIPPEGAEKVTVNDSVVALGSQKAWFEADKAVADARAGFADRTGTIFSVQLNEDDPESPNMHLVLFAGQFIDGDRVSELLVGDSLQDGMQRPSLEEARDRLARSMDWAGAIMGNTVSVTQPGPRLLPYIRHLG